MSAGDTARAAVSVDSAGSPEEENVSVTVFYSRTVNQLFHYL
jgi:hypothetical protein